MKRAWIQSGALSLPSEVNIGNRIVFFNVVEQNQKNIAQNNSQFKRSPNGVV
jgi:hypothetical protein